MTTSLTWKELREKIGIAAVNKELEERIKRIFGTLRDIAFDFREISNRESVGTQRILDRRS